MGERKHYYERKKDKGVAKVNRITIHFDSIFCRHSEKNKEENLSQTTRSVLCECVKEFKWVRSLGMNIDVSASKYSGREMLKCELSEFQWLFFFPPLRHLSIPVNLTNLSSKLIKRFLMLNVHREGEKKKHLWLIRSHIERVSFSYMTYCIEMNCTRFGTIEPHLYFKYTHTRAHTCYAEHRKWRFPIMYKYTTSRKLKYMVHA